MPLIEGIGDEVTIVFGLLLMAGVVLLAWLSTHTDDLSLIREMGVIVVELSQRRIGNRNTTAEDNEETPAATVQEASSEAPSPSRQGSESPCGESSSASSSRDVSLDATGSSNQSSAAGVVSASNLLQTQHADENVASQSVFPSEGVGEIGAVGGMGNLLEEEVVISASGDVKTESSFSQIPLDGEEVRQRRVQYFQREGHEGTIDSSVRDSHAPSSNIPVSVSKSEEEYGASPASKTENATPVNDSKRLSNFSNISDDLPAFSSTSEAADSDLSQENSQQSDSQIRVRLRYLNETQRCVFAKPDDTIGDFRRTHFQTELEDNKWVRFIFNGQDLRDDARTLQACNIVNNSTMHCLVTSNTRSQPQNDAVGEEEDDSMLGTLMYPLFTILLSIVWYFRFTYRQYFSAMSTVCLIGISFILVLSYLSSFRMSDSQNVQQSRPAAQSTSAVSNSRSADSNSD